MGYYVLQRNTEVNIYSENGDLIWNRNFRGGAAISINPTSSIIYEINYIFDEVVEIDIFNNSSKSFEVNIPGNLNNVIYDNKSNRIILALAEYSGILREINLEEKEAKNIFIAPANASTFINWSSVSERLIWYSRGSGIFSAAKDGSSINLLAGEDIAGECSGMFVDKGTNQIVWCNKNIVYKSDINGGNIEQHILPDSVSISTFQQRGSDYYYTHTGLYRLDITSTPIVIEKLINNFRHTYYTVTNDNNVVYYDDDYLYNYNFTDRAVTESLYLGEDKLIGLTTSNKSPEILVRQYHRQSRTAHSTLINSDLSAKLDSCELIQDIGGSFYSLGITFIEDFTVSTSEPEISYSLYPNPSDEWICITMPQNNPVHIEILSLTGSCVGLYRDIQSGDRISHNLPQGVYILNVNDISGKSTIGKFVVR